MAKAGSYNITIEEGANFDLDIVYKNSAGAQQDLSSGYTARMQIRDAPGGAVIDSTNSTPNNISIGSKNNSGVFTTSNLGAANADASIAIQISAATTAAYDFDSAVYDLELASGSGTVERVIEGRVKLSREVTG